MDDLLYNPVYNALCTGDQHLGFGTELVKWFDPAVAPFAGFKEGNSAGFATLHALLPEDSKIVYAIPDDITPPQGWFLKDLVKGLQFVYDGDGKLATDFSLVTPLNTTHVQQMIALVKLTKPGPFLERTIEFGSYHGIFDAGKLVAMTGQRMHVANYTEISAVCTHPAYLGKGYASVLLQHQLQLILQSGQQPFLHVRADNERAIAVYKRYGFKVSRPMTFYFMKRL